MRTMRYITRRHAELVSASRNRFRNKFGMTLILILFSILFFSCENSVDVAYDEQLEEAQAAAASQKAYVVFNLVESSRAAKRTITPAVTSPLFTDITFSGSRSDGVELAPITASSFTQLSGRSIEVEAGEWTFTLTAWLGKTASAPGGMYKATESLTVAPGNNELEMTLTPVTIGNDDSGNTYVLADHPGSWKVSLSFPYEKIDKIKFYLMPYNTYTTGTVPSSSLLHQYVKGTDYTSGSINIAESSLEMGSYVMYIEYFTNLTQQDGPDSTSVQEMLLNTWAELLRISPGALSEGTITLPNADNVYSIRYELGEPTHTVSGGSGYSWVTSPTEAIPLSYTRNSGTSGVITLPTEISLAAPDSFYNFEGWYTTSTFVDEHDNPTGPVTDFNVSDATDKTFYAKWHEPVYDVYVKVDADDSVADGTKTHPFSSVTLDTYHAFDNITGTNPDGSFKSTIHILSDYTGTNKITVPWGNNDTSLNGMCVNLVGEKGEVANADVELDVCVGSGNSFIYLDHSQQMKLSHINITSSADHTNPNGFGCISVKGGSWLSFEDSTIKGYTGEGCSAINIEGVVHLKNCEISGNKAIDRDTSSSVWANAVNYGNGSLHLEENVVIKSNKILKDDGSGNEESEAYNLYVGSYTGSLLNFMPIFINGNSLTGSEIWVKLAQEPHVFTTGYGTQAGEPSDYFHSDSGLVVDLDSSGEAQLVRRVSYYVSSTSSSPAGSDTAGDGSIEHPYASIEKAIEKITINDDDTLAPVIYVSGEIPCNIIIDDGSVGSRLVAQSLTIQGRTSATQSILNGDNNGDGTGDDSIILMSAQVPLTLKNLTLKNGNSTSSGGALCYDGRQLVTIDSCVFDSNEASVYGGALYFSNSDAAISNTSFISNSVTGTVSDYGQGGAIYIRGGNVSVSGSSSFTSNSAYRYGGAIALSSSSSSVLTLGKAGVESELTIKDNTAGNPAQTDNIHLNDGQTITVAGALSTDSEIGVTRTYSTDPFTTGYAGTNSGTTPDAIFTSDADYAVIAGTGGEAAFYMTTAGGTVYMPGDYHFTLAASRSSVTVGKAATVTVTPDITRTEPNGNSTPLFYNPSDRKLYLDSAFTLPEGSNNTVTWSASLWCGTEVEISNLSAGTGANSNKFTIPALSFENTYTLNVTATYQGYTHNANLPLQCQAGGALSIPFTLEAVSSAATVTFKNKASGPVTYIVNGGEAQTIAAKTTGTVTLSAAGDKVEFFGDNARYGSGTTQDCSKISCSSDCYIYGNIMSLINSTGYETANALTVNYCFRHLFSNNSKIKNKTGSELMLPAITLSNNCYDNMFCDCTSLTTAPELPATLSESCYEAMFKGCTSLTTVPELPATTLRNWCYKSMFEGCTSLTTAPELPATTLSISCYYGMFKGCTSLTTAPELPATTLRNWCYQSMFEGCASLTTAPELPATTLATECYYGMFEGCTSLTTAPELPVTSLRESCYNSMFEGCTSLTTAPELPATTLAEKCYYGMFWGCTSLNSVTCLATDISASDCVNNWLDNVAASGTFIKAAGVTWPTSVNGIPEGWTVQDAP